MKNKASDFKKGDLVVGPFVVPGHTQTNKAPLWHGGCGSNGLDYYPGLAVVRGPALYDPQKYVLLDVICGTRMSGAYRPNDLEKVANEDPEANAKLMGLIEKKKAEMHRADKDISNAKQRYTVAYEQLTTLRAELADQL